MCVKPLLSDDTLHRSAKIAKKPKKGRIDGQIFDFVKAGESAGSAT